MSLIYRALKSLQASRGKGTPGTAGPPPHKRPRSRIQRLRHQFVSPGVVMITAGLLILAGIGMVLGMEWLLERSRLVEPQVVSQRGGADAPSSSARIAPPPAPRRDDPVPPPPPPFEAPPPPTLTGEPAASVAGVVGRARPGTVADSAPVFEPATEAAGEVAFISPPAPDREIPVPSFEDTTPPTPASVGEVVDATDPMGTNGPPAAVAGSPTPPDTARAVPAPADARHPLPEGGGEAAPDPAYRMARTPDAAPIRPDTDTDTGTDTDAVPSAGTAADLPGISLKVRRQAEFADTARKLQGAMAAGNGPQAEALLLRLGRLQGEDNAFVLKMRAYWHLRNQRYELSEALLSEVLERMPGDLDAQLNMAVVEAHTGRREDASARLADLARRFPGEARVDSMARLLN